MSRILAFLYGVVCYLVILGTILYAIGFVDDLLVPRSIDSAPTAPLGQALTSISVSSSPSGRRRR